MKNFSLRLKSSRYHIPWTFLFMNYQPQNLQLSKICRPLNINSFSGPSSSGYCTRPRIFGFQSLKYRRVVFYLCLCCKIVNGFCGIKFDELFSWATAQLRRPNRYQLARKTCHCNKVLHSFPFRVVQIWNKLPQSIVEASNTSAFLHRLSEFDLHSVNNFALSAQEWWCGVVLLYLFLTILFGRLSLFYFTCLLFFAFAPDFVLMLPVVFPAVFFFLFMRLCVFFIRNCIASKDVNKWINK